MYKPDEEEVVQAEEAISDAAADTEETAMPEDTPPEDAEDQSIDEEE